MLYLLAREDLDGWLFFAFLAVIVVGIIVLVVVDVLMCSKIKQANNALKAGNLTEAFVKFRGVAYHQFGKPDQLGRKLSTFEMALLGLEKVFQQRNCPYDFTELRQLHEDNLQLNNNMKYRSILSNDLNEEGQAIRDLIMTKAKDILNAMPSE